MPGRHLLIVTYYFPPSTAIGGARWAAMVRHLRRRGHRVTVITSAVHGALAEDAAVGTLRTGDLATADVLRRLLRRPGLPTAGEAQPTTPPPALLARVLVPDSHIVSWLPGVVRAARRVIREQQVDALVTSGPPDSTHLLGLSLGRRRPAWIADFRDGWRFEPLAEPWPTRAQRALDAHLEARVARQADAVLGATRPIAEDFATRLGARATWVPNGWDPDLETEVRSAGVPAMGDDGWATLVHTGTLSGPRGRDPRPLLRALRRVNAEPAPGARRVRLVLAGRRSVDDDELLAEAGLDDEIRHVGLLERPAALALQRGADALLLLTGVNRSEATGKLYEYLASGRPILAVAQGNEAQRIIDATRTGVTLPADEQALTDALRRVADGSLAATHEPQGLERFTYPGPAQVVEQVLEEAIARRRR